MVGIHLAKLLPLTKIGIYKYFKPSYPLASYVSRRYLQEFPNLKVDNSQPKDYVLILPETFNEDSNSNEILRLPKVGEPETDFSKLDTESLFKGLSQAICEFENFVTDTNNGILREKKSAKEFFKSIEAHLYPMDMAYNILMVLLNVRSQGGNHKEILELLEKYLEVRDKRLMDKFKETAQNFSTNESGSTSPSDKKMIQIYYPLSIKRGAITKQDEYLMNQYRMHLKNEITLFQGNLTGANQLFTHTVDDPDILAVVSNDFDDCKDLHHKERTPLKVTNDTYRKFMQVCPDRFVRQNLWLTRNKRCSPKALPRYNNMNVISNIRVFRRKIANLIGHRTHVEYKIEGAMAKSKQQILDNLQSLNEENSTLVSDRLRELNDFAADNSFEDSGKLGIQEYDTDFWIHKYMYDILIGKSEADIKAYFPLPVVMRGLENYFKQYFSLEILPEEITGKLWAPDVQILNVSRRGQPVGKIIYDAYLRDGKRLTEPYYARLRGRNNDLGCLPVRLISTPYKLDPIKQQAYLSFDDILNLFYSYGLVLQRLLYNYDYYELNMRGCLEVDVNNLLPNLCVSHLLTDYRILQSCSDRGQSKPIDAELASRMVKAFTYFKSLRTWHELYMAHLDIEVHSNLSDIKSLVRDLYPIYSPFPRDPDNYDFCAMSEIFVGPNDGTQYADLWSKQVANFCLSNILTRNNASDMVSLEIDKIRAFNDELLDKLFDPNALDTDKKLLSLVGRSFEPSKASLGVL